MGLPKPAEKNLELTDEDLGKTVDMEKLTEGIERQIEQEENEICKFYKFFESFQLWLKENSENSEQFKTLTLEKLGILKDHIIKAIDLVRNIKEMTVSEEMLASKKIMIKMEVSNDYTQEGGFAKRLHYPNEIVTLAKDISERLDKSKEKITIDLKVEKQTEELIKNILNMLQGVQTKLKEFESHIENSDDLSALQDIFANLVTYIQDEKKAFDKLSEFEMIHLHLLSDLFTQEQDAVNEESKFIKEEKAAQANQKKKPEDFK